MVWYHKRRQCKIIQDAAHKCTPGLFLKMSENETPAVSGKKRARVNASSGAQQAAALAAKSTPSLSIKSFFNVALDTSEREGAVLRPRFSIVASIPARSPDLTSPPSTKALYDIDLSTIGEGFWNPVVALENTKVWKPAQSRGAGGKSATVVVDDLPETLDEALHCAIHSLQCQIRIVGYHITTLPLPAAPTASMVLCPPLCSSAYAAHFLSLLLASLPHPPDTLERTLPTNQICHLLKEDERSLIGRLLSLPVAAVGLASRLLSRKGHWTRAASLLQYEEIHAIPCKQHVTSRKVCSTATENLMEEIFESNTSLPTAGTASDSCPNVDLYKRYRAFPESCKWEALHAALLQLVEAGVVFPIGGKDMDECMSILEEVLAMPELKYIAGKLNISGNKPRDALVAAIKANVTGQTSVFGRQCNIAALLMQSLQIHARTGSSNGADSTGGQRLPSHLLLIRLSPAIISLVRRLHSLYYVTTSTSGASSGQGMGAWPCDASLALLTKVSSPLLSSTKWGGTSGSKYADSTAIQDSYIISAFGKGLAAQEGALKGQVSPGLLSRFKVLRFQTQTPNIRTMLFPSRAVVELFESANLFRMEMDHTCILSSAPVVTEAQTGVSSPLLSSPLSSPPASPSITTSLPYPHLTYGHFRSITGPHSSIESGSICPPTAVISPFLAGIDLLPFVALLCAPTASGAAAPAVELVDAISGTSTTDRSFQSVCHQAVGRVREHTCTSANVGAWPLHALTRLVGNTVCDFLHAKGFNPSVDAGYGSKLACFPEPLLVALRASLCLALCDIWIAATCVTPLFNHPWLHQMCAGALFTTIIWECVDWCERSKLYGHTIPLLVQLLGTPYTPHRTGRWWGRLCLNLSHLGCAASAKAAVEAAVADTRVRAGERVALCQRYRRLHKQQDKKECMDVEDGMDVFPVECPMPNIAPAALIRFHAFTPTTTVISSKLMNKEIGVKSRFLAAADSDNDEAVGDSPLLSEPTLVVDLTESQEQTWVNVSSSLLIAISANPEQHEAPSSLRVSVEEVALKHYKDTGGWEGLHCEGSPLRALFALLMWDVIFDSSGSDTFATVWQDGPLHLDTFGALQQYNGRVRTRLHCIAAMTVEGIIHEVACTYRACYGMVCRGIGWQNTPLPLLQLIAAALGGHRLAGLCDAFATNYKQLSSGMPDLLLWRVCSRKSERNPYEWLDGIGQFQLPQDAQADVMLIEVKGPRDTLSEKQIYWLEVFQLMGVKSGVLKIHETE
jgi:hypothetical protein